MDFTTSQLPTSTNVSAQASTDYWEWDAAFEALVHPFWRQFPPVPDLHHLLVGIYITVVGLLGTFGNLLVIYIFTSVRSLRTPSNILLVNLAASDFAYSAIQGFPLLAISSFNGRWAWGKLACELYGFTGGVFGFNSIYTLSMVAIDRYLVIAQPVESLKRLTYSRALLMVMACWLLSIMWCVPPFMGYGKWVPEGFQTTCTFDYLSQDQSTVIFNLCLYCGGFMLPVIVIFCCYCGIVRAVRNNERQMAKLAASMGAASMRSGDRRSDIKTAKVAVTSVSLFILSWLPYASVAFLSVIGLRHHLTPYTAMLPVLASKAAAIYNPLIYTLSHPKFQQAVKRKFPWLVCCCITRSQASSSNSSTNGRMSRRDTDVSVARVRQRTSSGEHDNPAFDDARV